MNDITKQEFDLIRAYIKQNYGINLGDEKRSLVYSRLRSTLQQMNFQSFKEYYDYLIADKTGEAIVTFIDKITTNHTFFMREVDHFYYFRDTILPYIEQTAKDKDLRVWSAGCSSGEEPYTLQMLIHDYFGARKKEWNTQLLATDISSQILSKAVSGAYSNEHIAPLSTEWKNKYFQKHDAANMVVVDDIKKDIVFRKLNLMEKKFPFKKKFQVIFCRNVMIYFDNPVKTALIQKIYDNLEDGGYFFIGHSESLNFTETDFKYVLPALYRK